MFAMNRSFLGILGPAALLAPLLAFGAPDADRGWPQFRGPDRNGISTETGWTVEGKPEPIWKQTVGLGYSGMAIFNDRLFTLGYDTEAGEDVLYCLDATDGEVKWTHRYPADIMARAHAGGTLSTPTVDGDRVYFCDRQGKFFCFMAETGALVWSKELMPEFNLELPKWGFAAGPMLLDDVIIMNVGKVIALDKLTGEVLWQSSVDYGDAYSTPVDFDYGGKRSLAVFNRTGFQVIDASNGAEISKHPWVTRADVNAAAPIVIGDRVFISSGYDHGCAMLSIKPGAMEVLWENKRMRNHMNACTLWEDHLYGFDDSVFKCLDLDGNETWAVRGTGKGAHILADGKIIMLTGKGELVFAEATPEEYREISRRKVLDGGVYWTTPVLLNGLIYCRNSNGDIVCLDHRAD